ncbi:hypothetical protein KM043_001968 [Ampulex compressa]|nr:hypothetical protein KM043_001968 [Ampulex compressa]
MRSRRSPWVKVRITSLQGHPVRLELDCTESLTQQLRRERDNARRRDGYQLCADKAARLSHGGIGPVLSRRLKFIDTP